MEINYLPDYCLLTIFNELNNLKDLVYCYQVCSRWNLLVKRRCHRVKYALRDLRNLKSERLKHVSICFGDHFPSDYDATDDHYQDLTKPRLSITCLGPHLFPNLRIINIATYLQEDDAETYIPPSDQFRRRLVQLVRESETIKGVVELTRDNLILFNCSEIEMIACIELTPNYFNHTNGPKIEQLYIEDGLGIFLKNYHFFPNLRILSSEFSLAEPFRFIEQATFPKLEILVLRCFCPSTESINTTLSLVNHCPVLKSIYLSIQVDEEPIDPNLLNIPVNERLEDLVLLFDPCEEESDDEWDFDTIAIFLSKFPNLKNLALRQLAYLTDSHVERVVKMFPNLVTLDLLYCSSITRSSRTFIQYFNAEHGRSIKLNYFGILPYDKVEFIDIESNFLANYCINKHWLQLPYFLEKID